MKQYTPEKALHALAVYCSKAERCVYNVRQKLIRWEIPEDAQKKIIKRLQDEKFIDESRFCKAYVNDKSKYAKWGFHKIRYELKKKFLPDSLIQEALSTIDSKVTKEQLLKLLQAKRKSVKGKNEFEINQKLMRFAASRGYSQEDTESVIKEL